MFTQTTLHIVGTATSALHMQNITVSIRALDGGWQGGHASQLGPQQVPGEAIWRLQNARKRFIGRGSVADLASGASALPRLASW